MCNQFLSLSSDGLCAFTAFLVSEFSEENIAFYFACEDYRNTKSPAKLPAKAQKIFDEFISSDAPREVMKDLESKCSPKKMYSFFVTNLKCTKRLMWFCLSALFPDKHRPRNSWHHQSQHAVTVALLFRHGPTQDLHADGQRLLPPVPPLPSLQGSSVPSQTNLQGTPAGEEGVNSLCDPMEHCQRSP